LGRQNPGIYPVRNSFLEKRRTTVNTKKENREDVCTQKGMPTLSISDDVLIAIIETVGQQKAETGGVIGGKSATGLITHFHFDKSSQNSLATYSPDHTSLNQLFKNDWNPKDIWLCGFVHSHPGGLNRPSQGDQIYAEKILNTNEDLECLWLPIVNTIPDTGAFRIVPWAVYPNRNGVEVVKGKFSVVKVKGKNNIKFPGLKFSYEEALDEIILSHENLYGIPGETTDSHKNIANTPVSTVNAATSQESKQRQRKKNDLGKTFERVEDAYDLDVLNKSRLIIVGDGGAASWIEESARTGISQYILIDHDVVSETNLATQQAYRRDINRAKVECVAERIIDINPNASVLPLQKDFFELSDKEIELMYTGSIDGATPGQSIICGLTDNFYVQARVNRLALKFGLPSLCGQVYKEGRGAEITFTYPGITPACHRCILSARYRYYIDERQENPVTSHGAPIFATTRLNAIKGFVLLAMLHHGTQHPRWGQMLSKIGKRNLIQVRMDPDFSETMGINVFDRVFERADKERLFFDEAVWLPQDPECPDTGYPYYCPDCGGSGDLRNAVGMCPDTRDKLTSTVESRREDNKADKSDITPERNQVKRGFFKWLRI
jgi:proteasome lid subunit RPN8/RPN11